MKTRIASVDIFRALTMLLMIFVNDLWTLQDIPQWLEHTTAEEDGMGLADVVFPAFLFIVGLSIPFALNARLKRGDTKAKVLGHILLRTLALVVMGFFMVNSENFRSDMPQGARTAWEVLMILAFLLIWNHYEKKKISGIPVWIFQTTGILLLVLLAVLYKGGSPEVHAWMSPRWWGILGLIGWAYLVCSVLYLLAGDRPWLIIIFWIALHVLNAQEFLPINGSGNGFRFIVSASNFALVMSGVLATVIYVRFKNSNREFLFPVLLLIPAVVSLVYGFWIRPLWGISKILATPSWTAICAGISFVSFAVIYVIADVYHINRWANAIMPAGRSTLTCYLVPTLVYPILWPLQQLLPQAFLEGWVGLIKSLLFALLIIWLTGLLERINIRLKI